MLTRVLKETHRMHHLYELEFHSLLREKVYEIFDFEKVDRHIAEFLWKKLADLVAEDLDEGAHLFANLDLWDLILKQADLILTSRVLQRDITYILLHACFNRKDRLKHYVIDPETKRKLMDLVLQIMITPPDMLVESLRDVKKEMSGAMDQFIQTAQVDERDCELEIASNCAWIFEKAA
jgi:hypothetical protein